MGFFGDLFSAAGTILGFVPGVGGVATATVNGIGKIIGGEEDRSRADAAAQQQAEYNQQYLDYLNKTNEQNYAMWRDQNIWNRDMMREANRFQFGLQQNQQDYNTQMWHMNNAYNDPSAQRDRWENAGFSPWTMAGGTGGGLVSSSAPTSGQGSAHQAQGVQPPQMQMMQQLTSPKVLKMGLMMDMNEVLIKNLRTSLESMDVDTRRRSQEELAKLQEKQGIYQEALASYMGAKKEEQEVINKYLDDNQFYQLQLLIRQYNNAIIDSNLKVEQIEELVSRSRYNNARARNIEIKNEADWRLLENYIASQMSMYILQEYTNDQLYDFYTKNPTIFQDVLKSESDYKTIGPWARLIMEILGLVPKFFNLHGNSN